MGFIVEHPFTFPHWQIIRIIFNDQYEDNYISSRLVIILSIHLEITSSCFYRDELDEHCIIQFECGEFIGGAKCFFDKSLSKIHPMILGRTWLDEKRDNFYKISNNIMLVCNGGICYQFQVKPFDVGQLFSNLSGKNEHDNIIRVEKFSSTSDSYEEWWNWIQHTLDKIQLSLQQKEAKVDDSKV